jgi:DNA-binding GntR family transcriptional regulator
MSAAVPYLPVPNLIRLINARDVFPAAVTDDELRQLISAAERLSGRAMRELSNRWTESLRAEQRAPR